MRMRPTQLMLLHLARDIEDEHLEELMISTGAPAGVMEKYRYDAIGYLVHLRRKSTLLEFLDCLKRAFSTIQLVTMRKTVERHEQECQEDDLTNNHTGEEFAPVCWDSKVTDEFNRTTFIMGRYIERKYIEIMKEVSPISDECKSRIKKFTDLCLKLKQCGCISEYNVDFLKQLLEELKLVQTLNMLVEYESNNPAPPPSNRAPRNQLRRQAGVERPGPSSSSGRYGTSNSLPDSFSSGGSSSASFHTARSDISDPGTSSGCGTPNSTGYFTAQSRASWCGSGNQRLLAKSLSLPASSLRSRYGEMLGIPPTDPTYPGGTTLTMSPSPTPFQFPVPPETPPPPHAPLLPQEPHPHHALHVQLPPQVSLAPMSSASGAGMGPSAPPEPILGQAAHHAPGDQVLGINVSSNVYDAQNVLSSYRGHQNNPGTSSSSQNSASQSASSLESFDSEARHQRPQSVQGNRQHTGSHGNAGYHGNGTQPPHFPGQGGSGEQSSCSYNRGGDNWQSPIPRHNTGTRHYVCPGLHQNEALPARQPSLGTSNNANSAERISACNGNSPLHPGSNDLGSSPNSSLRSSEIAGMESRSLGALTMSESGNLVLHPSNTSEHASGLLPSGFSASRLYPVLPVATGAANDKSRKRSLPTEDFFEVVKKIKVEDHVSPNNDSEEEEPFSTPPSTPPERAKS